MSESTTQAAERGVLLGHIRIDGGTQSRAAINEATVHEYAELWRAAVTFPPVVLFFDGVEHWLADGFHRYHAASRAGLDAIAADVRPGTRRDAVLYSLGANQAHGLQRTKADKRKAVLTLLNDEEWGQWSNQEIARRVGVSPSTVASVRDSLSKLESEPAPIRTYTTKHGTEATMRTENIGKRKHAQYDAIAERLKAGYAADQIAEELRVASVTVRAVRQAEGIEFLDKSRPAVEMRRETVRQMAADGHASDQIAAALGISVQGCRNIAKEIGVEINADAARGRSAKHDSNRILETIVMDAENLTAGVGLITVSALDRARLTAWVDSLIQSRRSLDAFIRKLTKEMQSHGEAA